MTKIKLKRGLEANRTAITPDEGELLYTTDDKKLFVGDGSTAGGNAIISGSGSGDVVGPASAIDDNIVSFDGITGELIKDSLITTTNVNSSIAHINLTNDPHDVTQTQVGLPNVDNTSDANKPVSTDTQTALDAKVDENVVITGATKTKITYDSKGLITSGADATTADIADSTDKRYISDAQLVVVGNTSGSNTGDLSNAEIKTAYELNADTNAYTDSEQTVVGNTSNTNTGDQASSDFAHNSLTGLNDGTTYEHLTATEKTNAATAYTHSGLTNNPHIVDKTDVGLSNVPNTDCTNASNISSGTLSSSVLPPIALTTVQVAVSQVAMLALTTEEGDVVVRSDENK